MIKATYIDHMGSDLSVVNAARVSFGKKSHCEELRWVDMGDWCGDMPVVDARDAKLISYLANHEHLSPFGHCFASFHIKAPIFVARQLVKHKFLRWNEISRSQRKLLNLWTDFVVKEQPKPFEPVADR